ncbi:MAG: class F sortase [Cryobacterium sp.]|uniref:class F sortase n=1 Tax=Cryobacterium sp. TaxID=1926290 RepID=UPI0022A4116F|nr:class F sortase [Cryobacterium sp.]MCY7405501.1 class F sortase [Cryobacterium sp.]
MGTGRAGSRRAAILAPALLALVISGCSAAPSTPAPSSSPSVSVSPLAPPPAPPPAPVIDVPTVDASLANQRPAAAAPTRIRIPSLNIDMTVEPAGLDAVGSMALAANPDIASWYRFGPAPGAEGATVIAAHVDSLRYGLGPFARLADAPAGTEIMVSSDDGVEHRYALESVQSTGKPEVPWAAVFDRTGSPRLTLVTCGGEFNYTTRQYQSNIVVTAIPVA